MDTITIGVAFKVPEEIKQQLEKINREISKQLPVRVTTDYGVFDPHITIYHVKFPKINKEEVLRIVESIAEKTRPVLFQPRDVNVKFTFVGVGFDITESIKELHKNIVTKLNPLREGIIKKTYIQKADNYTSTEKAYIDEYGYPYVFDEYKPHITLVNLEDEKDVEKAKEMIRWDQPFLISELTVLFSEKDQNGNIIKEVKTIKLHENN